MYYSPEKNRIFETHSEIRSAFPDVSMPSEITDDTLLGHGVLPLTDTPPAGLEFWQYSVRSGVEQINGKWYTKYIAGPVFATQAEQDAYVAAKTDEKNASLFKSIQEETQKRLDDFAATRNYSGILSACTYATSSVPKFAAEGQYSVQARDATWAKLYEILAEVEAGTRPIHGAYADIEAELPALVWPN